MKKIFFLIISIVIISSDVIAQNHKIGIKAGYTTSSARFRNNNLFFGSSGVSRGNDWYGYINGVQIGLPVNIDFGNDFLHIDITPQYSKYGFENLSRVELDYLDFDIGVSNINTQSISKIIGGIGITPSLLISSKNITDENNFDLKVYMLVGYRFTKKLSLYAQVKYGFIELVPDSETNNFQISFNLNYSIFNF